MKICVIVSIFLSIEYTEASWKGRGILRNRRGTLKYIVNYSLTGLKNCNIIITTSILNDNYLYDSYRTC